MKEKPLTVAVDPDWTLVEWQLFIEELLKTYKGTTRMKTDAGYNNVELDLVDRKER